MVAILDQINYLIEQRIENKNGDRISDYSHRNIKILGNVYILKMNGKEWIHFDNIKEMAEWLNQNGWKIYEEHKN